MRPGPPRGETAELEVTVTADMAEALVDGAAPVYGLGAMVGHMAEISRTILAPHLEAGEIGVGAHVEVERRVPVPVGAEVRLVATVAKVAPQQLVCEVLVRSGGLLAARGSYGLRVTTEHDFDTDVRERRSS